jgi:hypothetical protein
VASLRHDVRVRGRLHDGDLAAIAIGVEARPGDAVPREIDPLLAVSLYPRALRLIGLMRCETDARPPSLSVIDSVTV